MKQNNNVLGTPSTSVIFLEFDGSLLNNARGTRNTGEYSQLTTRRIFSHHEKRDEVSVIHFYCFLPCTTPDSAYDV